MMILWKDLSTQGKIAAINEHCVPNASYRDFTFQLKVGGVHGASRAALIGFFRRNKASISIPAPSLKIKRRTNQKTSISSNNKNIKQGHFRHSKPNVEVQKKVVSTYPKPSSDVAVKYLDQKNRVNCKYPLWSDNPNIPTDEKRVCGATPFDDNPYCGYHHDLCNPSNIRHNKRIKKSNHQLKETQ